MTSTCAPLRWMWSQQDRQYLELVRNRVVAGKPHLCDSFAVWVPDSTPLRDLLDSHLMNLRTNAHWLASVLRSSRGKGMGALMANSVHLQNPCAVRDGGGMAQACVSSFLTWARSPVKKHPQLCHIG